MVEEPTESDVVANPLALVVLVVGLTAPAPEVTAHVTTTFGTARPLASFAVTLRGVGSSAFPAGAPSSPRPPWAGVPVKAALVAHGVPQPTGPVNRLMTTPALVALSAGP